METASWINREFLTPILNGAEILEFDVTDAVPKSDHYFSTLLRVRVKYLHPSYKIPFITSYIIKTFPDGVLKDFMVESGAMMREITMYKTVLPLLNKISGKKQTPRSYECDLIKNNVLVLEDLNLIGFVMEDRIKQMDFQHCKFAIESLAEFHAASTILHETHSELIEKVGREVLYTKDNDYMKAFIVNCFKVLGNEVKLWPESSKYASNLLEFGDKVWETIISAIKPLDDDILVLNHGDFWTNNLLYHHNEAGDIDNMEFIDFQFCRWASPAFDLQRFFYTSVRNNNDLNELITCYLIKFNDFLRNRNSKIQLTKEILSSYLYRLNCYALISTVCLLPTCIQPHDQAMDYTDVTRENYDESFQNNNPYVKACKDPIFRKILSPLLTQFHEAGVL